MGRTWLRTLAIVALLATATAVLFLLTSMNLYEWGLQGIWPGVSFHSFPLAAPRLSFLQWEESCADGFYLIAPRGSYVQHQSPVLVDGRGNLVWTPEGQYGAAEATTDFKVQTYHGHNVLTFWAGIEGEHHRYGMGSYYMLDETYQVIKKVEPVKTSGHNLQGDIHEFHITPDDTALMTVYYPQPADLTSFGGPEDGWLLDSIFQEVDIDSGELIFEWRASDHITIDSTMRSSLDTNEGMTPISGFDYFHINSIDKDHLGNYIISARHTHQVLCISPQGETLWILGGKYNIFTDLSSGRATDFAWQHHARWHGNDTLSLFDNSKSTTTGDSNHTDHSRGLLLRLDTDTRTAKVLHDYYDPAHPKLASSQGSMQMMDDTGNVLVDYGFLPAWTEFSPAGDVLCDVHLAPSIIWKLGMVTSYRAFKTTQWVGRPRYAPKTHHRPADGILYVSWNGATEIENWVLQGAEWEGVHDEIFEDVDVQMKEGFEASFGITDDMPQYLRVAAVDRDGAVLGYAQVVDRYVGNAESTSLLQSPWIVIPVTLVVAIASFLALWQVRRVLLRHFPRGVTMAEVISEFKRMSFEWPGTSNQRMSRGLEYRELESWED
ncbi:hypothetical protein N0V93_002435 [Gnomoniopsis smithogilvyi]|uniref:ASST-domain-containing protein n=1 Tax=Gnomoniopsis smithogilvyi TaxID=1191159 RepID=A0A9W8YVA7_9PEZI|nr:hypothetical protein N0V93_002435 [Gnomoniopsis smithogilvyi]